MPWQARCSQTRRDLSVHVLFFVCFCLVLLDGVPGSVHADSAAPTLRSTQTAPRPGLLTQNRTGLLTQNRLTKAATSRTDFLMTHGNYAQTRFHLADRINRETVKNLKLDWSFEMDVTESIQTAPIVYDGVMYVTSSFNHLFALDAKTGRELWRYEHVMAPAVSLCCGPNNRGVEALDGLVYMGTLDSHLMALDARTGAVVWNRQIADPLRGYSITMAPTVVSGKVLIGLAGAEYGVRGALKALDARTGQEVWTFYVTPESSVGVWATKDAVGLPLHRDIAAEKARLSQRGDPYQTLGGSIWQNPSVDLKNRRIYFVVGNPSPDLDGSVRPGDNLYTDSLVSINLDTGKYVCHLQYVPHDVWDLDSVSPTVLTPVRNRAGAIVPGVIHAGKTGYLYVHDARDCSLIRVSEPLIDVKNERALPTAEGVVVRPGPNGGVSASPLAVDASRGVAFAVTTEQAIAYFKTVSTEYPDGKLWMGGALKGVPGESIEGALLAVDYNTGKIQWKVKKSAPMFGGVLATAGGLVFTGGATDTFAAYDSSNGSELWTYQADAGVNAPASTYELDGKQYVVVGAGGNTQLGSKRGNKILAFSY
jgi:PQQ-dependent dehydrogenase (methanol/ethanol family)